MEDEYFNRINSKCEAISKFSIEAIDEVIGRLCMSKNASTIQYLRNTQKNVRDISKNVMQPNNLTAHIDMLKQVQWIFSAVVKSSHANADEGNRDSDTSAGPNVIASRIALSDCMSLSYEISIAIREKKELEDGPPFWRQEQI